MCAALPGSTRAMGQLGKRLMTEEGLAESAQAALRVGVHWDTQCVPPCEHRVLQARARAASHHCPCIRAPIVLTLILPR